LIQRDYTSFFDYYTHADAGSPEITGKPVDEKEIYHTDLGRKVYGGGGITPDVLIKEEELSTFEQFLLARNAYVNFATDYANRNKIKADWKPDPDKLLAEFKGWVTKEKISTPEEMDKGLADKDVRAFSLLEISAEAMNTVGGQEARHRTLAAADKQLQEALKLFPKAGELLAQRRGQTLPKVETKDQGKGRG